MNLDRFDVKTIKTSYVAKHKTTKTTSIIMHCIDLTSKRSKTLRYVAKLQKWSNYNELHRFDVKTIKTFELRRNTTKVIKLQWIASIWHQNNQKCWDTSQNIQNYAKLRKSSNYNELHRFDVKKIKPTQKVDFISMHWDQNYAKLRKSSNYNELQIWSSKHSKQRKTTKVINYNELGSIWPQNDQKRWGTSQNIQNNGKLQNWSITMNCIDLRSKRSENPKLQTQSNNKQFASIWHQNDQNNAKLRKWSDYNALHRFDV